LALAEVRGSRARLARLGWGALVFALAALLYAPTLDHDFLNYDDDVYITDNPDQLQGLTPEGVRWAFTSFHGANWFPLTRLSWALDISLFGPEPAAFHRTNLLLHAATSLLLFLALARLTGRSGPSAFVAAVFAVHPLHVESVAWAAARKDTLSGLFFALALHLHGRGGREGPGRGARLGIFACLALGLMAKPTAAALPAVLLLLDYWPLGRLGRGRLVGPLREKWPLFALVAGFAAVGLAAQRAGGAWVSLEQMPLGVRVANALVACATYLGKLLWPSGLAVFYPHPGDALGAGSVVGAVLVLVAASALSLVRPYATVGWLWYLVALSPAIGLLQVGSQAMADRYMYLPLVGPTLALAWGACELADRSRRARRALAAAAAAAVAALALATQAQLRHWRDSEALFRHALEVSESSVAHAHLGAALLERGRVEETLAHYRRALELEPGFLRAGNNLAWLLATLPGRERSDRELALELARRASLQGGNADAAVLDTLAAAEASLGRFDAARETAGRALALAEAGGQADLARALRERLALYRQDRSYREPPPSRRRATR